MINLKAVLLLSAILLVGCESKKDKAKSEQLKRRAEFAKTYMPEMVDGNMEPPYPDYDLDRETLLGVDSDNDGIRDIVEISINRKGKNKNERNLLRKVYSNYVERFKNPNPTKKEFLINSGSDDVMAYCAALVYLPGQGRFTKHFSELNQIVLDTSKRRAADNNYRMKFPYIGEGLGNTELYFLGKCFCGFDIEDETNVFDRYRAEHFGNRDLGPALKRVLENNLSGKYERFFSKEEISSCYSHLMN